jgi:hypothetical protein
MRRRAEAFAEHPRAHQRGPHHRGFAQRRDLRDLHQREGVERGAERDARQRARRDAVLPRRLHRPRQRAAAEQQGGGGDAHAVEHEQPHDIGEGARRDAHAARVGHVVERDPDRGGEGPAERHLVGMRGESTRRARAARRRSPRRSRATSPAQPISGRLLVQYEHGEAGGQQRRGPTHDREDEAQIAALHRADEAELIGEMRRDGPGERSARSRHRAAARSARTGRSRSRRWRRAARARRDMSSPRFTARLASARREGGDQAERDGERLISHAPADARSSGVSTSTSSAGGATM